MKDNQQKHTWVEEIQENAQVTGLYLAKVKRTAVTRKGDPYLTITLGDRTGEVEARVWDRVEIFSSLFKEGDILDILGHASTYRNRIQLTLTDLKVAEDVGDPSLFLESTAHDVGEMLGALRTIFKEMHDGPLKELVNRFLSDRQFISLFKKAPAAKNFHHNYIGGLLEHTLSVCQMSLNLSRHYGQLDGDLLVTGAFLHDIGKVQELKYDHQIDYTDEGRLLGHLVLGVGMVEEKVLGMDAFPREQDNLVKHLILSHHGQFEFGSPKRPKFLEAFALHLIDDMDAKMNGLGRFMAHDRQDGAWTDFNRLFERYFLKRKVTSAGGEEKAETSPEDRQGALFSQ
ncbi:MAG: HD domain-containing protein [Deltaproteobacteria bacterium]|nr:HD domain-containing protein [Deltaproteobacteria bacterium]